jgi:hypothetical protein
MEINIDADNQARRLQQGSALMPPWGPQLLPDYTWRKAMLYKTHLVTKLWHLGERPPLGTPGFQVQLCLAQVCLVLGLPSLLLQGLV